MLDFQIRITSVEEYHIVKKILKEKYSLTFEPKEGDNSFLLGINLQSLPCYVFINVFTYKNRFKCIKHLSYYVDWNCWENFQRKTINYKQFVRFQKLNKLF